jgi:hypothetical protein
MAVANSVTGGLFGTRFGKLNRVNRGIGYGLPRFAYATQSIVVFRRIFTPIWAAVHEDLVFQVLAGHVVELELVVRGQPVVHVAHPPVAMMTPC